MAAALQVFFQHCFCGTYSQHMRPTAGDVTTCPCTYTQTPILMTKWDRNGHPQPKAGGTQDQYRGQLSITWPYATPHPVVSITNCSEGFEFLMAEHQDNPCITPSRSPSPTQGRAALTAACYGSQQRVQRRMAHPPPILHSALHILSDCPLVSIFHDHILKDYSIQYLFWTVKGAEALTTFLVCSNSLLCPLPACLDPP